MIHPRHKVLFYAKRKQYKIFSFSAFRKNEIRKKIAKKICFGPRPKGVLVAPK